MLFRSTSSSIQMQKGIASISAASDSVTVGGAWYKRVYYVETASVNSGNASLDFVVDSPENLNLFQQNLKYLGIEVTPGSHVDQVVKSLILNYQDRKAQGIFKHRWMLWVMKPFVWATLPFKYVGLVD